jgi:hypothetical protein
MHLCGSTFQNGYFLVNRTFIGSIITKRSEFTGIFKNTFNLLADIAIL